MSSMSPARATLLHSPGWNEGKARYETLGTHKTKSYMSSFRSGTNPRTQMLQQINTIQRPHPILALKCRSYGAQKYLETINPGLAPWALKKYRPLGALLHPTPIHLFYLMCLPSLN